MMSLVVEQMRQEYGDGVAELGSFAVQGGDRPAQRLRRQMAVYRHR